MTVPLLHLEHAGRAPARTGLSHAMIAPYGAYPVGCGGQMVIAIQNEREWARFCARVLGDAALEPPMRASRATLRKACEPPRDGRADRGGLQRARHGVAGRGPRRCGDRLRPAQRGRGAVPAPAAPACGGGDARRHGRDRGTPRPPHRRRVDAPPPTPSAPSRTLGEHSAAIRRGRLGTKTSIARTAYDRHASAPLNLRLGEPNGRLYRQGAVC